MNDIMIRPESTIEQSTGNTTAIAQVQAACALARGLPRDTEIARRTVLADCKRTRFAEMAIYSIPFWSAKERKHVPVEGPSIRLAEALGRAWGNMRVEPSLTHRDHEAEYWIVTAHDLQTNYQHAEACRVEHTSERRNVYKGQAVLSQRTGPDGQPVYVVPVKPAELSRNRNAALAKARRNAIIALVPRDILEECMDTVRATLAAEDPDRPDRVSRAIDRLAQGYGVDVAELSDYLNRPIDKLTDSDYPAIAAVGNTLKSGATWSSMYTAHKRESENPEKRPPEDQRKGEAHPLYATDGEEDY